MDELSGPRFSSGIYMARIKVGFRAYSHFG